MNGAAQANADTLPPVDNELAAVTPANNVRDRILEIAHNEFNKQNPGTFYSEGVRQAWCANFVSWVMRQAGDPLTNVTNGSWRVPGVYTLKDTFAASNKLEPVGYKPAPGDVVLYGGSGHTNIVVGVDGDNITTIGGNESNRISQRTISRFSGNIMGFGRVADSHLPEAPHVPEPTALPAPPPPPADPLLPPPPPSPEFVAPPVDPFLPPPPPPAPLIQPAVFEVPPPPPADPFLPPPPPVEIAPVVGELPPPPPADPFLPPPPPEVAPVVGELPPPADPFLPPPPPPVEFVPPAPEVVPAVFDAPPPPAPEVVELAAPIEGVPHLSGALPGPAV